MDVTPTEYYSTWAPPPTGVFATEHYSICSLPPIEVTARENIRTNT